MAKKSSIYIKTEHLYIVPMEDFSTRADLYSINWGIYLVKSKKEKLLIGKFHFNGPEELGVMSFEFEIDEPYRYKGYGTEFLKAVAEWALMQNKVYEIACEIPTKCEAAIRAINKAHFVYRKGDKISEHYSLTRQKSSWLGLYVILGLVVGLSLGIIFNNGVIGLIIGLVSGILFGGVLDSKANKEREAVTGKQE